MMPTVSQPVAPMLDVTTTPGATSENMIGIMTTSEI